MGKILITPRGYAKYGDEAGKRLEELGYELNVNRSGLPLSREQFVESAKEATGIIVGVDECDEALLKQCKDLKVIVKFGVGVDNIDLDAAKTLDISVGRCVGTNSNAVAEYTIGLMFAVSRHIVAAGCDVRSGGWKKPTGVELYGKTIGIIGFGNIGKHVARIANGIGMKVFVYDVFDIKQEDLDTYNAKSTSVEDIIVNSDFITLHVPLNDETKNMISTKEFRQMKKSACVINAARGGVVDEKALYEALKNGDIFASASDVFTSEPPERTDWVNELIAMDNFILTPHIGSRSEESEINTVNKATDVMIELLENHD